MCVRGKEGARYASKVDFDECVGDVYMSVCAGVLKFIE